MAMVDLSGDNAAAMLVPSETVTSIAPFLHDVMAKMYTIRQLRNKIFCFIG
jgi:hypothetical protein